MIEGLMKHEWKFAHHCIVQMMVLEEKRISQFNDAQETVAFLVNELPRLVKWEVVFDEAEKSILKFSLPKRKRNPRTNC